jgi:hypothetical protein
VREKRNSFSCFQNMCYRRRPLFELQSNVIRATTRDCGRRLRLSGAYFLGTAVNPCKVFENKEKF